MHDVPLPTLGASDLLVRLSASGVCGTDIGLATGHLGPTRDILGHEGVGRVVKLGSGLMDQDKPIAKEGDRVGIAWVRDQCGTCDFCQLPEGETRCREQLNSGRKIDGSFAQYAVVPSRYIINIPEGIPDEHVAPTLCGGVTAYKALKVSGATPGEWVAISGAGGSVGALGIQYAKSMGFQTLALDIGKQDFCLQLGADAYVDVAKSLDVVHEVRHITGGKMIQAALAIAGSANAYKLAMKLLGPYGTLVCVGIPPPDQTVPFHPLQFIDNGIKIVGSAVGTRSDISAALDFVARGLVTPTVEIIKLDDLAGLASKFAQVCLDILFWRI